ADTDMFVFIYIESSCIDRFIFTDNSELNIESLIKNLKNMIMKKLSVLYVTESSVFSSTLSVSFSATSSQSSTSVSVSDSPASATSVPVILTSATSDFTVSVFITSSPCFKKILYRLNELYLSVCTLLLFLLTLRIIYCIETAKDIYVFRNENVNIILFYTHECETYTPCLRFTPVSEIILIKDDNAAETTLSHSQASSVTFSLFSAEKVVCTSD
ncbi:hypothetical protein BDDG_12675, partial [Blastomyces dermatitidis ATCC 18188]